MRNSICVCVRSVMGWAFCVVDHLSRLLGCFSFEVFAKITPAPYGMDSFHSLHTKDGALFFSILFANLARLFCHMDSWMCLHDSTYAHLTVGI